MSQTVLIIEDEERIAHWVRTYFEDAGFATLMADNGIDGLALAQENQPDLVILDLMLPGMDGTEVCRVLRQESSIPIIMLTARGSESERIQGLNLGADDYVVKPFSLGELVARAQAVLRRAGRQTPHASVLLSGDIVLDPKAHNCMVDTENIQLSRIQFALLELFMRNPGQAFTREQLLDAVFEHAYEVFDRTIDVHIRRLRQKIEKDPRQPQHIITVYGVGYKFVE